MSGRPIGEIIGWERRGGPGFGYWCPPDVDYSDGSPPNCDDMLDYLKAGFDVATKTDQRGKFTDVTLTSRRSEIGTWFGPTLREALEAAVRAVAEAEA